MVVVLTNPIARTGGPKDGATCHGGHVLANIGGNGDPALSGSGTPMPKDGPWTTAGDPRLGDGGSYYGRGAQAKKVEIGPVSLFERAPTRVANLAGNTEVSGA